MTAKKKNSNKSLYIIVSVLVVFIIVAIVGKKAGWFGKGNVQEAQTEQAQKRVIKEVVSASGMIQPVTEVKISPDVAGEIIELHIKEGDSVAKGQLLLRIKPDLYVSGLQRAQAAYNQSQANLAESRARLKRAEATFLRTELEFNRNEKLRADNVISASDFELAEANYKIAKNDLESARQTVNASESMLKSAQATVNEAKENLSFTSIMAPMSGTISKLDVELGERVVGTKQMAGTEMLRIADLTKMEARVDVNENDIIRVQVNDSVDIDVDSYSHTGRTFKGVVTAIANTANSKASADAVTEFEVKIIILNSSYQDLIEEKNIISPFRPGMTASVEIVTDLKKDVLTVPLSAVTMRVPGDEKSIGDKKEDDGDSDSKSDKKDEKVEVVFLHKDGKAIKTPIKTGISDFDYVEVLEGVQENDEIIVKPFVLINKKLKGGEDIKITNKSSDKDEEEGEKE